MIYGSVCSGVEAATMAWHPLGWKPAFFSEIERFPRQVLTHHYPKVPLHGDFTTIKENDYEPVDLLVGGTPCQDFSIAGKGEGLDGERGNLTLEYAHLAKRLRVRWFLWENVPGVFSSNGGNDFAAVIACLAGYPTGYKFKIPEGGWRNSGIVPPANTNSHGLAWRTLDAQYFGVPQRRRRVFVVGYLGDWRPAAAVLFERESLRGDITPRRETGEDVARGAAYGIDEECNGSTDVFGTLLKGGEGGTRQSVAYPSTGDTSHCLNGGGMGRQDFETETLIAYPINTQIAMRHEALGEGTGFGVGDNGDPSFTLQAHHSHAVAFDMRGREDGSQFEGPHETANIRAASGGSSRSYIADMQVRRLTPVECERLQGFPDDYTLIPNAAGGGRVADGPRYKAMGNSMAVPVMRWLGERIHMVDGMLI